jgi:hypothetical protein
MYNTQSYTRRHTNTHTHPHTHSLSHKLTHTHSLTTAYMHGVDDVDEGHIGHHELEEIRAQVQNGTHSQTASATAQHGQTRGTREVIPNEVFGHIDAVRECVLLVEVLSVLVPGAA